MPLVVLCFSSSLRNGSNPAAVGAKLRCALCAEKANRNRGSTKKGIPHLIASSASGATLLRIACSRRKCGWPSRGAARIYSAIVVGRLLAISWLGVTDSRPRGRTGAGLDLPSGEWMVPVLYLGQRHFLHSGLPNWLSHDSASGLGTMAKTSTVEPTTS